MKLYVLRPYVDARKGPQRKPSLWRRFWDWLMPPRKASIFRFRNPTAWKLERVRRAARNRL